MIFNILDPFDMEECYEFFSLAFAAMPYRFLYLSVDSWAEAMPIMGVKFFYKTGVYVLVLRYKSWLK